MNKLLILLFKKENGKNFKFSIVFPVESVNGQDVAGIANIIIQKNIFEFKDNSPIKELEKAYYQEVTQQAVNIA